MITRNMNASSKVLGKLSKKDLLTIIEDDDDYFFSDTESEEENTTVLLARIVELQSKVCLLASSSVGESLSHAPSQSPSQAPKRQCIRNDVTEMISAYTDKEFIKHFKLSKALFGKFVSMYETSDCFERLRPDKRMDARKQILVFFWFATHEGCSFRDVSKTFDIGISSVSIIIKRLTYYFSGLSSEAIKWPSAKQKKVTSEYFKNKSGIPHIIGAIDVTRVIIDLPKTSKDEYIDKNGDASICLQGICNENKRFIDVHISFPGTTTDSWVFENSPVYQDLNRLCGDYFILGDSAYPCLANLLTPYKDNGLLTSAQRIYNTKSSSCRVIIEDTFSILKERFRQLNYCKLRSIDKICHFIRACCVIHNYIMDEKFEDTIEIRENNLETSFSEVNNIEYGRDTKLGKQKRDKICSLMQS